MTTEELNKLKENLPNDYKKLLADKCDCSTALVSKVFNGSRGKTPTAILILKAAVDMAENYQKELDDLSNRINGLKQ